MPTTTTPAKKKSEAPTQGPSTPLTFLVPRTAFLAIAKVAAQIAAHEYGTSTLSNVCLEVRDDSVTVVATDGYRLLRQKLPTLARDTSYPNTAQIMSTAFKGWITVDRDSLIGALAAVPGVPRESHAVTLTAKPGLLTLMGERLGPKGEPGADRPTLQGLSVSIPCAIPTDGEAAVKVNTVYLTQSLKSLPPGTVTLFHNGPTSALAIAQGEADSGIPAATLLMPIRP